jgi:hypothetical protein
LPHSNEVQSFKCKLESAINERLLTVSAEKSSSLQNMVKKEISFFEVEGINL